MECTNDTPGTTLHDHYLFRPLSGGQMDTRITVTVPRMFSTVITSVYSGERFRGDPRLGLNPLYFY